MKNTQADIWNEVYSKGDSEYPWTGIQFSAEAIKFIEILDKKEKIIVVGCGTGESVNTISEMGYVNVIGSDISSVAISHAKLKYPNIFISAPTEELYMNKDLIGSNVFDWLNLHQIMPVDMVNYIYSICRISNKICISWIYHDGQEEFKKSYVHDLYIYFHRPDYVESVFLKNHFKLESQSNFDFTSNTKSKDIIHSAVTQIYTKHE
jgi:SAM-dependent methyltransferase